jgi:hypothetical protein
MAIKNRSQYDLGFCRRPDAITVDWNGRSSRPLKPLFSLPNQAGSFFQFPVKLKSEVRKSREPRFSNRATLTGIASPTDDAWTV